MTKRLICIALAMLTGACAEKHESWIQLFNGKDLNDWTPKFAKHPVGENYNNTFRVEDGILKVSYDDWDEFDGEYGHLFYKTPYSHYRLRVEYRFVGEQVKGGAGWAFRNNGLMLHGQTPETMELNQAFPTSVEVQLLGGTGTGKRPTMNVCTPGTNIVLNGELQLDHCFSSTSKTHYGDEWVTAEVEVHGDSIIKHIIDGEVVMQYSQPQLDERDPSYATLLPANGDKLLRSGTISIQAESAPTEFRKIELLDLTKK
ncbi:MAG: DUF1080 domain-containing protein [Bacteroidales bacterium]|nr:DUF1080 domain-containing protein [Bacteroidales bacterium]